MKRPAIIVLLLLLAACQAALGASKRGDLLIVPGQSVGRTHLGANGALELAHLPKPQVSDAGMSQTHTVWVSRRSGRKQFHTLYIHAVSNGALSVKPLNGVTIDTIRVTSPWFHTSGHLHVGSTLAQIRRRFPQIKAANGDPTMYDDKGHGIAFEFAATPTTHSHCIAVMIHPRGETRTANARQVSELRQETPH